MKRDSVSNPTSSTRAGCKIRKVIGGKRVVLSHLSKTLEDPKCEFVIKVDRSSGQPLGADVDLSDGKTIRVDHVKEVGVIQTWNLANASAMVLPRYRLVEVNGVRGDANALIEECTQCKELSITVRKPAVKKASSSTRRIVARLEDVNWMPLESNPDMFNLFSTSIGLSEQWSFVDVLGVDSDFLSMVPRPCVGVILLFQYSETLNQALKQQHTSTISDGRSVSPDVFFMKQFVGNACGTIAALHCLANSSERLELSSDSALARFLVGVEGKTSRDIGAALADFEEFHVASEEAAEEGQTEALEADEDTDHHFIAFVEKSGDVYELDGAKASPINHGSSEGDLLKVAARVIQDQFMKLDPGNLHFSMMALVHAT